MIASIAIIKRIITTTITLRVVYGKQFEARKMKRELCKRNEKPSQVKESVHRLSLLMSSTSTSLIGTSNNLRLNIIHYLHRVSNFNHSILIIYNIATIWRISQSSSESTKKKKKKLQNKHEFWNRSSQLIEIDFNALAAFRFRFIFFIY